jgi:hypothetical protein
MSRETNEKEVETLTRHKEALLLNLRIFLREVRACRGLLLGPVVRTPGPI